MAYGFHLKRFWNAQFFFRRRKQFSYILYFGNMYIYLFSRFSKLIVQKAYLVMKCFIYWEQT